MAIAEKPNSRQNLKNKKKWAAYTYTGFVGVNQIVLLTMGVWTAMALIIPAIVVGVALTHVKEME